MTAPVPGTPAPAVLRAVSVLETIARTEGEHPRVADIARALELPKSSTTNILAALVEAGLVRRIGSGHALGPMTVELASAFLRTDDPVNRFRDFVPVLPALSEETAQLATLDRSDVGYLARHDGRQPITLTSGIGQRLPASSTALGKAMLSQLTDSALTGLFNGPLPQLTERSHRTWETLRNDLMETRERGYALDDEEAAPNVVCLAVAVPSQSGDLSYAVSTTLFKNRLDDSLRERLFRDLGLLAGYLAAN